MDWWKKAKFGMFIHWGLYSLLGGVWNGKEVRYYSEWLMSTKKILDPEYGKLAATFNPTKFDADEWVKIAKQAGMKYIVFTTLHHEGFSMYHSKVTKYNITDATPFKRDPLAELVKACRKEKIKLGIYYSLLDWHRLGKPSMFGQILNFPEHYFDFVREQIKELLTNYGEISILFFDADWMFRWNKKLGNELMSTIRKLQPNIIINDRIGKRPITNFIPIVKSLTLGAPKIGDYATIEQAVPFNAKKFCWETCMTMNKSWGYKKFDNEWKSPKKIIQILSDVINTGGNLLLNVGPTGEGEIPEPSVKILKEVGDWVKTQNFYV